MKFEDFEATTPGPVAAAERGGSNPDSPNGANGHARAESAMGVPRHRLLEKDSDSRGPDAAVGERAPDRIESEHHESTERSLIAADTTGQSDQNEVDPSSDVGNRREMPDQPLNGDRKADQSPDDPQLAKLQEKVEKINGDLAESHSTKEEIEGYLPAARMAYVRELLGKAATVNTPVDLDLTKFRANSSSASPSELSSLPKTALSLLRQRHGSNKSDGGAASRYDLLQTALGLVEENITSLSEKRDEYGKQIEELEAELDKSKAEQRNVGLSDGTIAFPDNSQAALRLQN